MKSVYSFTNRITSFLLMLSMFFFFSCSKEVIPSDVDFQKHLVGGTGAFQNTFKIWKLDSMAVDGKSYALTTNQKKYTKKFYHSGAYIESEDIVTGKQIGRAHV